jgi:hypothetical protein
VPDIGEIRHLLDTATLAVLGHVTPSDAPRTSGDASRVIDIAPKGRFPTCGIGVGLRTMHDPAVAGARAPVAASAGRTRQDTP